MSNCKVISFFSKSTQIILITVLPMNTDHLHMAKLPTQSAGVQIVTTVTLAHFTVKSLIWNLKISLAAKFNPNWEFDQLNQDRKNLIQLIVSVCKFMIEGKINLNL